MKSIRRAEWANLILVLAIALGAYMRFNPTLLSGFPINDGGMFAVMMDDLKSAHYLLPAYTSYNQANIPFAYPPLGFYLGTLLSGILGWSSIQAVRWLPAFFATLSIPAFYLLALRILKKKYHAALAVLFFALTPRAFMWYVMGGGLTRSLGLFFMLLALASLVRLYQENRSVDILMAGIFCGLSVLSHPEAAVYTLVSALLFWIMLSRRWMGFVNSVFVALITLVVSAPWWITVIHYHGLAPLISAASTGQRSAAVLHLLFFRFTEEPYATLVAILALAGIAFCLVRREYLLPVWMVIPFIVAGRSAVNAAMIPLAMLAAIGLVDGILLALQWFGRSNQVEDRVQAMGMNDPDGQVSSYERNLLFYVLFFLVFSTYEFGLQLSSATLYQPDREAMLWVRKNTAPAARFLILTGTSSVACDPVMEWFPALTGRRSIDTIQGTEWTQGNNFGNFIRSSYAAQACMNGEAATCLDQAVPRDAYDFIYVSKVLHEDNCMPVAPARGFPYFLEKLQENQDFQTVYDTQDVTIVRNLRN
jgi:hypothetical protein